MADLESTYQINGRDAVLPLVATPATPAEMNARFFSINNRLQRLEEGGSTPIMVYKDGSLVGLGGGTLVRLIACPYKMQNPKVALGVLTIPTGADLLVNVFHGIEPGGGAPGTSFFVVNPKAKIIASSTSGVSDAGSGNVFFPSDAGTVVLQGESIGVVIDQVGSGAPGADLGVTIFGEPIA